MQATTQQAGPERFAGFWRYFERADRYFRQLELVGMWMAGAFLAAVTLLLLGGVFARPWTGFIFSLALEGGAMSMWPISYLGAAYIWRIYGHVQFDLVLRITHYRTHHILQFLNNFAAFTVGGLFAWFAWHSFMFQWISQSSTQNLRYPHWPMFWTAFVGTGLLATELVFSLLRHTREIIRPTGSEEQIYGVYTGESPRAPLV